MPINRSSDSTTHQTPSAFSSDRLVTTLVISCSVNESTSPNALSAMKEVEKLVFTKRDLISDSSALTGSAMPIGRRDLYKYNPHDPFIFWNINALKDPEPSYSNSLVLERHDTDDARTFQKDTQRARRSLVITSLSRNKTSTCHWAVDEWD